VISKNSIQPSAIIGVDLYFNNIEIQETPNRRCLLLRRRAVAACSGQESDQIGEM
jgi:hypothetical protein